MSNVLPDLLILVPGLPFLAFAFLWMFGRRMSPGAVGFWGSVAPVLSFVIASRAATSVWSGDTNQVARVVFTWFAAGDLVVPFGLRVDGLSGVLALLVTGVGSLIHVYSIGYMWGDKRFDRYFAYLNLFVGMMLLLVLADNLALLFVGWEGVGLCSYLLIGFWFEEMGNSRAAQKAFLVNRIGDAAFLMGLFLAAKTFHTLDLFALNQMASETSGSAAVLGIAALLFVGATGKSAQIPLYVWLPDAMAGPTPVSALIHAATMVTSGVYLVARLGGLYSAAPGVGEAIAVVGALTAIFAAFVALGQRDIKKVLAYSTVSQLGYMFIAVGVGAYATGVFHLLTHGFFKALLFLAAGSVIHGLGGEQDIFKMGGLRRSMPLTYASFVVGGLALAGVPFFAGFFSKDAILAAALAAAQGPGGPGYLFAYGAGLVSAFLTAFYIFRLIAIVFFGEPRHEHHVHDADPAMGTSLLVLILLSALGGFLGAQSLGEGERSPIQAALGTVQDRMVANEHQHHANMMASVAVALGGTVIGFALYTRRRTWVEAWTRRPLGAGLARLSANKFYVDEVYDALVVRPVRGLAGWSLAWIDRATIDGTLHLLGVSTVGVGEGMRRLAGGRLRSYVTAMAFGALGILALLYYVQMMR